MKSKSRSRANAPGAGWLGRSRPVFQQRSARTALGLLEATVACLVEHGYARLTTAAIAGRAGVSEGALFRHYPTKADLVVAAVAHVFEALDRRYLEMIGRAGKSADPVAAAVRTLWKVMTLPEYLVTNEIYLAARSDPALSAAIGPMARRHQDNLIRRARELYAPGQGPELDDALDALILAMQGAAIDSVALQDRGTERRRLAYFEQFARRSLEAAPEERPRKRPEGRQKEES